MIEKLFNAVRTNDIKAIQECINAKVDLNVKSFHGETAIMYASRYDYKKIAELLIDAKVDLSIKNINGRTAIKIASEYGHTEIVKLIEERLLEIKIDASNLIKRAYKLHRLKPDHPYCRRTLLQGFNDMQNWSNPY